jgi:hypothetical protein
MDVCRLVFRSVILAWMWFPFSTEAAAEESECRVVQKATGVELQSPSFVFRLDLRTGLRAEGWEDRLTGRRISLGGGPELEVDLGPLGGPLQTPQWQVSPSALPPATSSPGSEAVFQLTAKEPPLSARVTYRWTAKEPVLRKFVQITNTGEKEVRLLNVRLGTYRTAAKLADREQGFPVYLDDEFFMSLAHPAGWATAKDGTVSLRHYPGTRLAPGKTLECMETVYGVGQAGAARKTFLAHVRSRMRRVVRGHDKPYAIFDNFGSWPSGDFNNSEAFMLHSLGRLAESQKLAGCRFDLCNIHFWVDYAGDLKRFDPQRFPNGIAKIKSILDQLGTAPGMWIDSSMISWSIGRNPATKSALTDDPGYFCRASEPIKSMYRDAFRYHIREHGVRLLKFDNLRTVCNNPKHEHLPGVYSTEAIENSVIEFLHDLDRECPDVFFILYWGHRSPWWLLHGDTLFDSGIGIEAASPSSQPAPYARDSVTQKLDQAQWHSSDVPALGKDSLGVWLSSWGWNSSIGKDRWQEGVVMDISRGSMLAQIWADNDWLSPPEWKQLADLLALLRARPECFGNPRFILGSPWKDEPYGYCCTDGRRAFLALNNCTWQDRSLPLELNAAWGLPDGQSWDLYRWYPEPAKLKGDAAAFGTKAAITLRPFEVVLLEVVPAGQRPTLDRPLDVQPVPAGFAEPSRTVDLSVGTPDERTKEAVPSIWTVLEPATAVSAGGATLTKQSDGSIFASGKNPSPDIYTITANTTLTGITGIRLEVLADPRLPSRGPGRVYNGNFALREFSVTVASRGRQAAPTAVTLHKPAASFSQTSYGGWPIEAAIDGDPKTAWSIDPCEGESHEATFETRAPMGLSEGATLTFTLQQGYLTESADHTIGRLRLSVTTSKPPIPPPARKGPRRLSVRAQSPASARGGTLVVAAELKRGAELLWLGDIGTHFSAEARLGDRPVACQPVLGTATYPSSWQAWRISLGPSAAPQAVELRITTSLPTGVQPAFRGHFIPRTPNQDRGRNTETAPLLR